MTIKVGFGFDVHQLKDGADLWIGGVKIPAEKGAVGHSDADVLIHAICDALLGAINLRDIGTHFPNTDPRYKGISSLKLLQEVCTRVIENGYTVNNIDTTVSLEDPKISEYIPQMKEKLAEASCLTIGDISIKATTTEKLGFTGRKEGIAAYCVALVKKVA
ncbi:MAG TPA: 2-C-methyl-D-erythritol 2,4-cyclodiphosphate synthase [Bacteroidales bacterium]|nr:2-C-methyl-D-erythritol 2,4-cyclodiphosphate synthase [Bacteroidales bacterium]HPE58172.1 2-C-methyl-D-erythritol 2,4-cyclodiphosphate synthase [Bacteroidales bacterium]HRX96415.1 2-C-methyl-D-erythritol 2,4-cyclodiphosphate synthase [Bacteroidales bacterium]